MIERLIEKLSSPYPAYSKIPEGKQTVTLTHLEYNTIHKSDWTPYKYGIYWNDKVDREVGRKITVLHFWVPISSVWIDFHGVCCPG